MKTNIITLTLVSLLLSAGLKAQAEYSKDTGFEAQYLAHTTHKAIDFKKKDALQWYTNNVDKDKFYYLSFYHPKFHNATNEIKTQKGEALEWYSNNVDKNKFYLINHGNADKQIASLKKRALKWHERNSQS